MFTNQKFDSLAGRLTTTKLQRKKRTNNNVYSAKSHPDPRI